MWTRCGALTTTTTTTVAMRTSRAARASSSARATATRAFAARRAPHVRGARVDALKCARRAAVRSMATTTTTHARIGGVIDVARVTEIAGSAALEVSKSVRMRGVEAPDVDNHTWRGV